jgi:uncharacterized membrane protein YfhO
MGAIKDAVDLITELQKRTSDRKLLDALFPIREKILEAKEEQLDLKEAHSKEMTNLKEKHSKEMDDLKASHSKEMMDLKAEHHKEVADLKAEIARLQTEILKMQEEKNKNKDMKTISLTRC